MAGDTLYEDFYDACQLNNVAAYARVQEYMDTIDVFNATMLNNTILDSNLFESDRKLVNDIYIKTWLSGISDFTTEQRDTLEYIAYLHSLERGDAVLSARVLLGLEVVDDESSNSTYKKGKSPSNNESRNEKVTPSKLEEEQTVNLYPNPAKGEIKVDVGTSGEIEIYNLLGEKVIFTTLVKGSNTISTFTLKSGVYFYTVYINGKNVKRDKLVIIE